MTGDRLPELVGPLDFADWLAWVHSGKKPRTKPRTKPRPHGRKQTLEKRNAFMGYGAALGRRL